MPDVAFFRQERLFGSLRQRVLREFQFPGLLHRPKAGRILNPSAEAAASKPFPNLSCSLKSSGSSAVDDACSSVVVGPLRPEALHQNSSECKPGLECDQGSCTASCGLGVCVPTKPLVASEESCTGDSACVEPTAICNQSLQLRRRGC